MTATNRPKRAVVLAADNPMAEVHGEFFWREDHDVLVSEARELLWRESTAFLCAAPPESCYKASARAGWADSAGRQPTTLVLRRRPTLLGRIRAVILLGLLAVGLVIVFATIAQQWMRQF